MKSVFIPSTNELYQMQDMNVNLYKYLLAKVIEIITVEGVNRPGNGILKSTYSYLKEDPYIAAAICSMYPEELKHTLIATTDIHLCLKLIKDYKEKTKCGLDYLSSFDASVLDNTIVLKEVITKLEQILKENPRYRFEYQESQLLKKIFNREISDIDIIFIKEVVPKLLNIEPAYGITLNDNYFNMYYERSSNVSAAVNNYADTYGIPSRVGTEYIGKDILTNPDTEVKKLMRCINCRK